MDLKTGDPCPDCGKSLQILQNAFYSPWAGYHSGLICSKTCPKQCLRINPDDDFFKACQETFSEYLKTI